MSNLVRCKACGFFSDQEKIKDVCPACGVSAKMFEPFTHPVSVRRRRILDLHTHPVTVHFPQAFALTLAALSGFAFFAPQCLLDKLFPTIQVLAFLLPFSVSAAVATGLLDGKLRFRKVTTPMLRMKIVLSTILFVNAVIMAVLALSDPEFSFSTHVTFFLLAVVVSACGALLGLIGGKLLDAKFPG